MSIAAEQSSTGALTELVRDGDRLLVATGPSEPRLLIEELVGVTASARRDLELVQVTTGSTGLLGKAVEHGHRMLSPAGSRSAAVEALPSSMRQLARDIDSGALRIDGVLFSGLLSGAEVVPGMCVDLVPLAFSAARFRAVELNRAAPDVPVSHRFPRDRCALVVHSDYPPPELPPVPAGPATRAIGAYIADVLPKDAVLEVGVGRALAGLTTALIDKGAHLSIHSGLISDWTRALVDAGVVDGRLSCAGGAPVVAATAMGTAAFYRWLDRNESVLLADSRHAHDPGHLASLPRFFAVNAASRVDFSGQVGVRREEADLRGVGGLLDFAAAGSYSGGSIIATESVDGRGESRIVPFLFDVQLPSMLVTHVVTEFGVARLAGRTWRERKTEMIAVAHPDHRAWLRREMNSA